MIRRLCSAAPLSAVRQEVSSSCEAPQQRGVAGRAAPDMDVVAGCYDAAATSTALAAGCYISSTVSQNTWGQLSHVYRA